MYYTMLAMVFVLSRFSLSQDSLLSHHHHTRALPKEDSVKHRHHDTGADSASAGMHAAHSRSMSMDNSGEWMFMSHGNLFIRYIYQGGKRGGKELSIPNWLMASAQRAIGKKGSIEFRSMVSFDRITDGGDGYPLLLQSGETWNGNPLVDRQHPHDLFAELSATYRYSFDGTAGAAVSIAYPGEPAIGPPAFMHRPAAQFNPDAPIGHHWQDATHISFGVATAGFRYGPLNWEGSVFTGREPDENRFNFDRPRFDSYSSRVTYSSGEALTLQMSYGFLKNPEGHGDDVNRISASILYSNAFSESEAIHISGIFGQNREHHASVRSYLLELAYLIGDVGLYGRHESVEKPRFDLGIVQDKEKKELVHQITAGINAKIAAYAGRTVRAGVQGAMSVVTAYLEPLYGMNPMSFQIYLQVQ